MAKTAKRVSLYMPVDVEEKLIELANKMNDANKNSKTGKRAKGISKSGAGLMIITDFFKNTVEI